MLLDTRLERVPDWVSRVRVQDRFLRFFSV